MIIKKTSFTFTLIILALVLSSCLGGSDETLTVDEQIQVVVGATQTKEAFLRSVQSARETEEIEILPTPTNTVPPAEAVPPTIAPSLTPEPIHQTLPGSPSNYHMIVPDIVTVDLAEDKTAIGDNYAWSRLERPYTPKTMEYRSYLDIYQVALTGTDTWIYVTYILIGKLPAESDMRFSVELDLDHDGRGDFLVTAALPADTEWTTDNVLVLADENEDIGGLYPLYMESEVEDEDKEDEEEDEEIVDKAEDQDGYERVIFDSGQGADPDLAWVRRDPDSKNQLQFAFKESLTGSIGFLWSVWTDEGIKDPGLFDLNDHFTYEYAGSPNKGNYRYPVNAVALVDSTCRSWYAFVPTGIEPGLCYTGDMHQELQGYGWCEANPKRTDCGSHMCKDKCPANRFCVPCKKP